MPPGLIWHSYLASPKEPRISGVLSSDVGVDTKLDGTLGGRVGLLRYGNSASFRPQGWQLDVEAAAFIREDLTQSSDVDGYDFRIGFPITYGWDQLALQILLVSHQFALGRRVSTEASHHYAHQLQPQRAVWRACRTI